MSPSSSNCKVPSRETGFHWYTSPDSCKTYNRFFLSVPAETFGVTKISQSGYMTFPKATSHVFFFFCAGPEWVARLPEGHEALCIGLRGDSLVGREMQVAARLHS